VAHSFLERLAQQPLLADGAMGTLIYARGVPFSHAYDELNASQPDLVEQIHREYIAAGVDLIETNTFGANRIRLAEFGLEDRVRELNNRGVRIAREAREVAGEGVFVAGSIGPIGQPLAPIGAVTLHNVRQAFREQVEALLERGIDLVVLETFYDLAEITEAILAVRETTDLPLVAQMSFGEEGHISSGQDAAEVARALERLGADVVGLNCGVGPQRALDVVHQLAQATGRPLSAQPNAGLPATVGGRTVYVSTPEYFADFARTVTAAGVRLVGGCCGTTPEHIRAMKIGLTAVDAPAARRVAVVTPAPPPPSDDGAEENPAALRAKLERGDFVVSVELDPPRGLNPRKAIEGAIALRDVGVDCINIGDSPMATVRMSAMGMALLMIKHAGVEPIIHCTTRDRNLMALQSELLGAHANGIRNIIALTGDPPRQGQGTKATAIHDVDSIGLIAMLKRFNQGIDAAGRPIGRRADFTVACAWPGPGPENFQKELDRLRQKIEAGADLIMSQPMWTIKQLVELERRAGKLPIPHLLGILPLESHKHAELLHHEVPGMIVPDEVREKMRRAGEHGREVGLELTMEFIEQARKHVAGVYIITSYGRYGVAIDLARQLRA